MPLVERTVPMHGLRFAGLFLVGLVAAAASCDRPPDAEQQEAAASVVTTPGAVCRQGSVCPSSADAVRPAAGIIGNEDQGECRVRCEERQAECDRGCSGTI